MAKAARKRRQETGPGYDGAEHFTTRVKVSLTRSEPRLIRARPGTFEWRYNRDDSNLTPLYHAGVKFADLWERAGAASASSPDWRLSGGGDWKGLPDARLMAMDQIKAARLDIGKWGTARLVDYCVMGSTVAEMAEKYDTDERVMAHVLAMDLRACAVHFKMLRA